MFRNDSPRARLMQDLRHTYMPSLFDVEAIRQRNVKSEEVLLFVNFSHNYLYMYCFFNY